jgi:hypothetical protein
MLDLSSAPNKNRAVALPPAGTLGDSEARHSDEWYGDALRNRPLRRGDRMFIRCEGGPCISRLETFPPRIEIEERDGLYILVDDGPLEAWMYQFVTRT